MELRTLRAFVEVIRCGGFTEAGKTIFATQSTVSKMVKQLEEDVGVQLIDRSAPRPRPTEPGLLVYQRALDMLAMRDELLMQIGELHSFKRGVLRVGVPTVGGDTLFAPVIAEYRRRFPLIQINLIEHGSARLHELLRGGDLDVAGILLPVESDLEYRKVRREPVVVLTPEGAYPARKTSISLAELQDQSFLLFQQGFALNEMILAACRRQGFVPNVAMQSAQTRFIAKLVEARLGVAFMPRMVAMADRPDSVAILELDNPDIVWDMSLAWRRDGYLPKAATAFIDLVQEIVADQ
ncbi:MULTISPECIES: LysR family transcriptional regulator [unclassified Rhizobium]|uniref:LysR family transcriptional regulator n=1 Tax=unclassified Rhizobium TaxID=2613769 RepID=UPI0010535D36|nr:MULTISPECIES: LysR family transcriptional regulator [unclassified Rhizobium]MBB3397015.1 DNA-binding transcriptional LysR family regulator [Rhizobium sp. BK060]MBB4170759.1 DNA-binding transcriptional LysR family regulator [Rhizobium sp. BK538]TCM75971.1 DNA-binding transcriptional LysR family regulator [Rhizobium sp. BK068]